VSFDGFDRGLLRFLTELRGNNEREWFHPPAEVFTPEFPRFCAERLPAFDATR
jgi:hypothetical protein